MYQKTNLVTPCYTPDVTPLCVPYQSNLPAGLFKISDHLNSFFGSSSNVLTFQMSDTILIELLPRSILF